MKSALSLEFAPPPFLAAALDAAAAKAAAAESAAAGGDDRERQTPHGAQPLGARPFPRHSLSQRPSALVSTGELS